MRREISGPGSRKARIQAFMTRFLRSPTFELAGWFFVLGLSIILYLLEMLPEFSMLAIELEEKW